MWNMTEKTRVLYNADCPVCRFEIDHYAAYSAAKALPIGFDDLNSDALHEWGISADDATRRLHVLKDGALYSGIPAFIVLWQDMPRYRPLARLVSLPGVNWLAVQVYDRILAPLLYRWNLRRMKKGAETSTQM